MPANEPVEPLKSGESGAEFVLAVVAALTAVPNHRTAVSLLARACVPRAAEWCTVHAREPDGTVRQLAAAHADPARVGALRELGRRCGLDASVAGTLAHAVTSGQATLVPRVDESSAARFLGCDVATHPELVAGFREVGLASLIVVPLALGGERRGALTWARGPGSPAFGHGDLSLAGTLAAHVEGVLTAAWRLESERQARADAEAARQQVTSALDDLPDVFLTVDRHGTVTSLNAAAAALSPLGRGAAAGRSVAELFHDDLGGPLLAAVRVAVRDGRVVEHEAFDPGTRGWYAVRAVPTRAGASLHLRDVSARHAADEERERLLVEAQLARAEAESARTSAEYANRAKGEFLATMSHELRTPLNAILGYAALLADGITGPVAPEQLPALGRVRASAQHLLALIEEILAFARLEAGTVEMQAVPAELGALAREAAELVEPVIETHGLRFVVATPPAPEPVRTDVRKVRQILLNLLANAARFTPAGGEVALTAAREDGTVLFTVRDTGVGIDAEHHERIFEPFWQVEQKLTRRMGGTGLGLSVSRRLARLMGGDLTVESEPGRGSVFTVRLPAAPPALAE